MLDVRLAYALAVVLAGGLLLGFSGFGAGFIFIPLLSLIYSPGEAVALLMIMGSLGTAMLVPKAISQTKWRETFPMSLSAILALPLGAYFLLTVDPDTMRRIIGICVFALSFFMFCGAKYAGSRDIISSMFAGVVSGAIAGATGLGRLIVGLYFVSSKDAAITQRANIIIVGSFIAIFNLLILALNGVATLELLFRAGILFLPFAAMIWLGSKLFRVSTGEAFRQFVLSLVMIISVVTVVV